MAAKISDDNLDLVAGGKDSASTSHPGRGVCASCGNPTPISRLWHGLCENCRNKLPADITAGL